MISCRTAALALLLTTVALGSEGGKVVIIQAGPPWQVLSTSDLGEDTCATPAVAGNHIYLRTMSTLYCFGNLQD